MSSFVVRQEEDRIRARPWGVVYVAALVMTSIAMVVAGLLLHASGGEVRGRTAPGVAPAQIDIVEQTLIGDTQRGLDVRGQQRRNIERWAWTDRDAGLARIPIETAMDLVARGAAPDAGAPAKGAR